MRKPLPSRSEILKLLGGEERPLHAREIAERFDVDEGSYMGLLRLLDNLTFDGAVTARDGHRFKIAARARVERGAESREGLLTVNARGFGFVASPAHPSDDVFVPQEALAGGMHGDTVVVEVAARGPRGPEGRIVSVSARGRKRVAGVLRRRGRSAWLEPEDTRVRGPVPLPDDLDLKDGEGNSGKDGDLAVVAITRFPELPDETPVGKLEAVLGKPGELSVEVRRVLFMHEVEEVHSTTAFAEAEAYGPTVPTGMLEDREDWTEFPLPTIDPEDARDHDDAVWVERSARGGYRALIAIADVSSYVVPGTRLDDEAKKRGCSIYLPDRAIPMLPRPLSSNLCSLLPDATRLCLGVDVELDASGRVTKRRLVRAFMRSRAKLTYGGVARALGFTDAPPREPLAEHFIEGLRVLHELARLLRARRLKRGALDFDLPEAKVLLGEDGKPTDIVRRAQDPGMKKAYQLVEELMLLANETVAEWMTEKNLPTIYRIHESPDETKLDRLAAMCEVLGVPFEPEEAKDPKTLSVLLRRFAEHPRAQVLNMLLLRSMKQATYAVGNAGHFGLASTHYLHFTSPIRRYPDLVVHRIVHAALTGAGDRASTTRQKLEEAAMASSAAERRAMEIERQVVDIYRCVLMRDKIGEEFFGTVTSVVGSGVFVALDAPFVDVLVRAEDLGEDAYTIDDEGLRAVASRSGDVVTLGDRMLVRILDVAIVRGTILGQRVGSLAERDGEAPPRRGRKGRDGKEKPRDGRGPWSPEPGRRGSKHAKRAASPASTHPRGDKGKAAPPKGKGGGKPVKKGKGPKRRGR